MEFLYYLPDQGPIGTPQRAAELGLAHVFDDDHSPSYNVLHCGPDGGRGCLISRGDRCIYDGSPTRETQRWRAIHDHPHGAWVGMWLDARPTPASLVRAELLDGRELVTDDGGRWQIPIALHWAEENNERRWTNRLPCLMTRHAHTGQWMRGDVVSKYRHLWNFLNEYARDLSAAVDQARTFGADTYTVPESRDRLAFAAFTANYRVAEAELDLLGVIDTRLCARVVEIVEDLAGYTAIQKKTSSVGA